VNPKRVEQNIHLMRHTISITCGVNFERFTITK